MDHSRKEKSDYLIVRCPRCRRYAAVCHRSVVSYIMVPSVKVRCVNKDCLETVGDTLIDIEDAFRMANRDVFEYLVSKARARFFEVMLWSVDDYSSIVIGSGTKGGLFLSRKKSSYKPRLMHQFFSFPLPNKLDKDALRPYS